MMDCGRCLKPSWKDQRLLLVYRWAACTEKQLQLRPLPTRREAARSLFLVNTGCQLYLGMVQRSAHRAFGGDSARGLIAEGTGVNGCSLGGSNL